MPSALTDMLRTNSSTAFVSPALQRVVLKLTTVHRSTCTGRKTLIFLSVCLSPAELTSLKYDESLSEMLLQSPPPPPLFLNVHTGITKPHTHFICDKHKQGT